MPVRLNSSGGGSVTLDVPSTGSAFNLTLPAASGNLGINLAAAQNSTSGTNIDFTGIPAGVRRVTVMFRDVSTNGSNSLLVQVGTSAGVATSGYVATGARFSPGASSMTSSTAGQPIPLASTSEILSGHCVFTNFSGNTWVSSFVGKIATGGVANGGGDVALAGALDRVRITTVGGTDTFDAGSINVAWEF